MGNGGENCPFLCLSTLPLLMLCPPFCLSLFPEYDSDSSCHYKTERSYENFIISGPDLHPPPIADDESDDDDDDDVPRVSRASGPRLEQPCGGFGVKRKHPPSRPRLFGVEQRFRGRLDPLPALLPPQQTPPFLCRRTTTPCW